MECGSSLQTHSMCVFYGGWDGTSQMVDWPVIRIKDFSVFATSTCFRTARVQWNINELLPRELDEPVLLGRKIGLSNATSQEVEIPGLEHFARR